jgi:hypothetical protein
MLMNDGGVKLMDFGIALLTRATGSRLTPQGSTIGTFRYMAPEQFDGEPSDALTDIFSVGVVFYELLTWKHPFHAREAAALMHNILKQEAAPLRSLNPEFPEALERIVAKLLVKDREQRYQTLDDVLFDLEAVHLELARNRAADLLADARKREAAGELEAAQALVREILELDPTHREAREMRENLQRQIHRKALQVRVDALVRSGKEELAERRYPSAIQSFESAVHLDRTNPELKTLLEEARSKMEHGLTALRRVADAQKGMDRRDFAAAHEALADALRHDPENPTAASLLRTVEEELARLKRERAVEDAIQVARTFLWIQAYDDAADALASLGEDANSPKVRHLLDWIRRQKVESERKERLKAGMTAATDLLRAQMFHEAVQWLERLAAEFPDDKEVSQLYQYAQTEAAGRRQAREVERISAEAGALIAANDYAGALRVIEEGLWSYPQDAALERLKASTNSAKAIWERRRAVQATLRYCGQLGSQMRFAEAIQVAESTQREFGAEPLLADAIRRLEAAWEQQQREEGARKAADIGRAEREALALVGTRDYDGALRLVELNLQRWPSDEKLLALHERVRAERDANRFW